VRNPTPSRYNYPGEPLLRAVRLTTKTIHLARYQKTLCLLPGPMAPADRPGYRPEETATCRNCLGVLEQAHGAPIERNHP